MPPNTNPTVEAIAENFEKLNLKQLARNNDNYQVYPKISVRFINGCDVPKNEKLIILCIIVSPS